MDRFIEGGTEGIAGKGGPCLHRRCRQYSLSLSLSLSLSTPLELELCSMSRCRLFPAESTA